MNDDEVIRPVSVHRNAIKAIEVRGLIRPAEGKKNASYRVAFAKQSQVNFPSRFVLDITPAIRRILVVCDTLLPALSLIRGNYSDDGLL